MNKYITLLALVLFATNSTAQKKNTPANIQQDIEAVKKIIERETKAFFEIDYKTWEDSWAKVPYAYWSFADTTDVNFFEGWESIKSGFADYFKNSKPSTAKINREWHDIKVQGNMAYVRFTQKVNDNIRRDDQAEVRVLEKINGNWKIVHVGVIARQKPRALNHPR
jgi:hypothetical protein